MQVIGVPTAGRAIWLFLKALPWQFYAALLLLVLVLALRWHWIGVGEERVQAEFGAYRAEVIAKTKAAKEAADRAEKAQALAFSVIAAQHKRELDDAAKKGKDVTAGLNAGTVRLRDHWRCPSLPQVAAGPAGTAGADQRRAESAGRIVGIGATCDARVKALQDLLRAERQ